MIQNRVMSLTSTLLIVGDITSPSNTHFIIVSAFDIPYFLLCDEIKEYKLL